jgi:type IV pilus assembly protein PilW
MTAFNLRRKMQGLSLIEILIALAIGSLLVLGLVEVFAASRTAYQLSTGLARVQENGRFAMDYLQRDLRMAGHLGCVNDQARFLPANTSGTRLALASTFVGAGSSDFSALDPALRFDIGISGHEAAATASGDTLDLSTTPAVAADGNAWTPAIDARVFADMVEPVVGSDVVELRFFLPNGAQMTSFDPAATPVAIGFDPDQLDRLTEGATNPGLFGISDCMNAAVFRATTRTSSGMTVAAGGMNVSTLTGNEGFVGGQARIYRAESVVYYVGLNVNDQPALRRIRYVATPGADFVAADEELVEGIESLQLQYGQDSRTQYSETPTGNIGTSAVADALIAPTDLGTPGNPPASADNLSIHTWRRVGIVQVGLVARSTEPAAAYQRADGVTQLSALGVVMNPPNDTLYRAVYEDTVALRNRLFGN